MTMPAAGRAVEIDFGKSMTEREFTESVEKLSRIDNGQTFNGSTAVSDDPRQVMIVLNEGASPADLEARARELFPGVTTRNYPVMAIGKGAEQYADILETLGGLDDAQAKAQARAARAYRGIAAGARTYGKVAELADATGLSGRTRKAAAISAGALAAAALPEEDKEKRGLALAALAGTLGGHEGRGTRA